MSKIRPDSKDAIIEAAFEVFSETPTAGLKEVAARAGVGRATLHRHFEGRSELMRALAFTALSELENAAARAVENATSHEDGFRLSFHAIVPLANRQWFLAHEDFPPESDISKAYAASQAEFLADIEEAKREGLFHAGTPTLWIAEAYENLTYAAWAMVRAGEATPKQAAELAWTTFSNGVIGDPK